MDHGARQHSRYGASIAHRWFNCPGSVRLEAKAPPEVPSPSALRGTAAHELLEALIKARFDHQAEASLKANADPELLSGVSVCLEHVDLLLDANPDAIFYSEVGFTLPSAVIGDEAYGTCDVAIVLPRRRQLHIIDYKNGVEIVDEVENLQLLDYATGVWFNVPGIADMVDEVVITIVQPNAFHPGGPIREWSTTPARLLDFMAEFDEAALRTLDENAPLVPGLKTCQYCKAASICPALKAKGLDAAIRGATDIKLVSAAALPNPEHMRLDELAYTLAAGEFLKLWLDRCEEAAYALMLKGHLVPGRKLVHKISRRKWDGDEAEIAENMTLVFPVTLDDVMPRKMLGLTAMDALISEKVREATRKGKKKEAVAQAKETLAFFTVKEPSTELTAAPMADRRPAVNPLANATAGISLPHMTAPKA